MFLKKKSGPAIETGNGAGSTTKSRSNKDGQQNLSPVSPPLEAAATAVAVASSSSSPSYAYEIPTLHASPTTIDQPPGLTLRVPSQAPRHGRSVSHPFPSTTGPSGGGVREPGRPADIKGAGGARGGGSNGRGGKGKFSFFSSSLPKQSSKSQTAPEPDLITGRCATCDSTVRWPRQLDVFRCTVCAMVNDLQYGTIKETPAGTDGQHGGPNIPRKVLPVSVERTKSLISQCTHAFLRRKIDELQKSKHSPNFRREVSKEGEPQASGIAAQSQGSLLSAGPSSRLNPRSASRGPPGNERGQLNVEKRSFDSERPRTAPGQPRASEDTAPFQPRYIFRHFESYLISCLNDCDCLNMSFAIARPAAPVRAASETSAQQGPQKPFDPLEGTEAGFVGELDPKMLLMGDIGENARFWLGDGNDNTEQQEQGHASHTSKKKTGPSFERRPPRFNWKQVWDWYQSILLCGRNWRSVRSNSFSEEERHLLHNPKVEREIDQMLAEGRHHVQRTLLKATENLLRHPGRPVKRPEDARFLLILILNPLLHPQHSHHGSTWSAEKVVDAIKFPDTTPSDQAARRMEHAKSAAEAASKGSATGHHSGILKRLIGLIGNLPQECNSTIISWLHRMPVPQLHDLVDLVSGFVSYRLTRNSGRARAASHDPTNGLIPVLTGPSSGTSAQLHAAIGGESSTKPPKTEKKDKPKENAYADDWQVKTSAKVMSLLFHANFGHHRGRQQLHDDPVSSSSHSSSKQRSLRPGQALPLSDYYNVLLDDADLLADFELWELKRNKFSFCQYPMFLSIGAKIQLMEFDARRQMQDKARNAFFDSIMTRKVVNQYLILHVRRECLLEDSLKEISKVVGAGEEEIKKGLKIEFDREEGIDIGGLRKEWFLLLVREAFDPRHGLFLYDEDSQYCYFNPNTFETSEQYFLIGVVLGLAIYNSTILDISLPPFLFRKLLAAAPPWAGPTISTPRPHMTYTLDDLAEWRPNLAKGLRQLLEFEGDVESTFCRDFVVDVERYGATQQIPLVHGGEKRAVTNSNRREFVDLYVRHILDWSVARQFEPFKRGFFTVCSGNALALFRPEEIELLVRGSDEALDVESLQAVALYDNWDWARHEVDISNIPDGGTKPFSVPSHLATQIPQIRWFWETFKEADAKDQRRLLGFITGSDRIPAMGTTSVVVKVAYLSSDYRRVPIARTCFNTIGLYAYETKEQLKHKLWMAVDWSEGFGLK